MKTLSLGSRTIGDGHPCLIVAELGVNHQGDPEIAARLIRMATECGANAVKLQKRNPSAILTRAALDAPYVNERSFGRTYGEHRAALELPDSIWPSLKAYATERGLLFFATPYDIGSAEFLADLGVPAVKIASCDVTNLPFLEVVAQMGVPVILSTGMSTEEEIDRAVRVIWHHTQDLVLMNCVSTYPATPGELNLRYMLKLRKRFQTLVGHSGHERGLATTLAAVTLGASVVERHFTLSKHAKGPDHAASLLPEDLLRLVCDIREIEAALVERPKHILKSERPIRDRLAKSIVSTRPIAAGEVIERSMLCLKGPGTGMSPLEMDGLLGKHAAKAIPADVLIVPEMIR